MSTPAPKAASTLSQKDSVPRAFQLMTKPTGAVCNLDCDYCFFLSKDLLYPDGHFRMEEHTLHNYVAQLLAAHPTDAEVVFAFQGGEPTMMGISFCKEVLARQAALVKPGQRILNTMQTNATLIDDKWGEFLAANKFLVGISIDGPAPMHDAFRKDKGGKPTFDRVVAGIEVLKHHNVEWNALTTINSANAGHGAAVYNFLIQELGAQYIQFIPIVERMEAMLLDRVESQVWGSGTAMEHMYRQQGDTVSSRSVAPAAFGAFMIQVFETWARRDVGDVFVQMFDTALAHWLSMDQVGMCVHAKTCGDALALEHNGDIYSCDHFVEPDYKIGNINDDRPPLEIIDSPQQASFGAAKEVQLTDYCRECPVLFACNGGCPKDRFSLTPTGESGLHYLCEGYREFFSHIDLPIRIMANAFRQGRDADRVRDWYRKKDADRAPEDPCTCGLGSTWSACHGRFPSA